MTAPRIPLNFFGIPFGLAGLAGAWLTLADYHRVPVAVGNTVMAVSAGAWLIVLAAYLRHLGSEPSILGRDLLDPIASPFASLAVITPMLWAAEEIYPHATVTGRVVLDVFLTLTVLLGSWFTGQWIYGPLELDKLHPGYFLPTVAGGLVASYGAAAVGQHRLAEVMFGYGVVSWLVVGSLILGRLFFRPTLPAPLYPTLAIEVAPAAVASLAYLAWHGDRLDMVTSLLAGYGALMILAQLRLLPAYLRLPFMPSTWAFTFSWAAVATASLHWLQLGRPGGYVVGEFAVLVVISALVVAIALRTVLALGRGQLLPAAPTAAGVRRTVVGVAAAEGAARV